MKINIKHIIHRIPSALLCAAMTAGTLISAAGSVPVFAEETADTGTGQTTVQTNYDSTRARIEAEYTRTADVSDWADSTQKNYEIAENSTDDNYFMKAVEWTDIEKGEALITLAGRDTEESVALFTFTTCTAHTASGTTEASSGMMPEVVLRDIERLQEMYDRVDCIAVNGNDAWDTISGSGFSYSEVRSRTTDSNGDKQWNKSKSSFVWDSSAVVRAAGGIGNYYIGINPVRSFTKENTEDDIKNWLMSFPWMGGQHTTASLPAAVRAYLFGDISLEKYGTAQSGDDISTYKQALTEAMNTEPVLSNMVHRPAAIYAAGDAVADYPSTGSKLNVSQLYKESSDSDFITFLATWYTTYGGGTKRYFSLASSRKYFLQDSRSSKNTADDLTVKAYTAMFQPGEVAANQSARVVKSTSSGLISYSSQGTEYLRPDYEYQEDFREAGVLTPNKTISFEDNISDLFEITGAEAFTADGVQTTVQIDGQKVTASADEYHSGDEMTLQIRVKLRTGTGTRISGENIPTSDGDSEMYDGNISIYTVQPLLALPGADDVRTNVNIKITWKDDSDRDGIRPEKTSVTLIGSDGSAYDAEISNNDTETLKFENLIRRQDGEDITYEMTGDLPAGYSMANTGITEEEDGILLTAEPIHQPATRAITIRKNWDDTEDVDGIRPDNVIVEITGTDGSVFMKTIYASEGWEGTADGLFAYYDHGTPMEYDVTEVETDGYSSNVSTASDGSVQITNSHEQEKREIDVTLTWKDDEDRDGIRPQNQEVILKASDGHGYKVELTEKNGWRYTFPDLPVNYSGSKITYTLSETAPDGYTGAVAVTDGGGFAVTNTHEIATKTIKATGTWDDEDNRDGVRPDRVKLTLQGSDGSSRIISISEENEWTKTVQNLPVYYSKGKEITYTFAEPNVNYYSSRQESTDHGSTVSWRFTHTPLRKDLTAYKKWDDGNNADGLRADVTLVLSGSDGSTYKGTIKKDAADQQYTFKNLYVYSDGEEIVYSLTESAMSGYTSKIVTAKDGFTVTNSHPVQAKSVTEPENPDDGKPVIQKVLNTPKTGDNFKILLYGGILAVTGAVIITGIAVWRKRKCGRSHGMRGRK